MVAGVRRSLVFVVVLAVVLVAVIVLVLTMVPGCEVRPLGGWILHHRVLHCRARSECATEVLQLQPFRGGGAHTI